MIGIHLNLSNYTVGKLSDRSYYFDLLDYLYIT